MRLKIVLILILIYSIDNSLLAQAKIDSLLAVLKNAHKNEETGILRKLALEYKNQNMAAKAIEYSQKVLQIGEAAADNELMAFAHENIGEVYNINNDLEKSLTEERIALALVDRNTNTQLLANIYSGFAAIFINRALLDSAIFYTKKGLLVNDVLKDYQGLCTGNFFLAVIENGKGNNDQSLAYYEKALHYINKTDNKIYGAQILNRMATAYISVGDYPKAIDRCLQSLAITSKSHLKARSAITYTRLGSIYHKMGDIDKALDYFKNAKEVIDKYGIVGNDLAALYNEYGALYDTKGDYIQALAFKQKALALNEKAEFKDQTTEDNNNIGESYVKLQQYSTALRHFEKALDLSHQFTDSITMCAIVKNIADVYSQAPESTLAALKINNLVRQQFVIKTYTEALAIAKAINNIEVQKKVYQSLSKAYEQQNDFPKAFAAYKEFIDIKDKIFNDNTKQKINRLEIQYEYDKKEDSIKLEQAIINNKLQQQQFLNQQQAQNILLQRNKLLLSEQQLALINKEKDLQHLAYLKTQADLQTEQLQKNEQEKLLILTKKEKALEAAQVKALSQENDLNKLRRRQQLIYSVAGFAVLFFAGLYLYNRNRQKQVQLKADMAKEKAEQQQKEAEFQRSLADVSLSALRSQMNPHFIFNCLNSIKLYTTQNETAAAANYLTKFSKLIRMALENSRSATVTLQSELESLDLYIQMEAMRFKDKLKYTITVDENVDSSFIEIPPLLLQPYVENAIWHGLMHKDEGGHIAVKVTQVNEESLLVISIQDDGVGREKAALLRGKTTALHKSYGTKVTAERLALINQVYKTEASVTTVDVINNAGAIAGTLVTIKIPFE